MLKAAIDAANQSALDPNDKDRVIGDASLVLGGVRRQANQNVEAAAYFDRRCDVRSLERRLRHRAGAGPDRHLHAAAVWKEEPLLERALLHARAAGLKEIEADALHLWADGLFSDGQYERALAKLLEAETVAKAADDIRRGLGTIYNSMGRLYRNHGQLETALDYQLKALSLHEKLPGSFVLMQSLNAVGVTYQAMGITLTAASS